MFLCINSYSKTLSRRISYALFSQPVVGLWGQNSQTTTGAPPLDPAGGISSQNPNLPTVGKNHAGAPPPMLANPISNPDRYPVPNHTLALTLKFDMFERFWLNNCSHGEISGETSRGNVPIAAVVGSQVTIICLHFHLHTTCFIMILSI